MRIFFKKTVFIFFGMVAANIYSAPIENCELVEFNSADEVVSVIQENVSYCVKNISENKVYLKEDNILINGKGMFIQVDERRVARLPMVYSDLNGLFIYIEAFSFLSQNY